jgi:hypothetical protein
MSWSERQRPKHFLVTRATQKNHLTHRDHSSSYVQAVDACARACMVCSRASALAAGPSSLERPRLKRCRSVVIQAVSSEVLARTRRLWAGALGVHMGETRLTQLLPRRWKGARARRARTTPWYAYNCMHCTILPGCATIASGSGDAVYTFGAKCLTVGFILRGGSEPALHNLWCSIE